jgi:hypothetical protein
MTFPRARLYVSALLFFSWICFLGYLVYTSSRVILSRPQFLIAQAYVVADVSVGAAKGELNPEVTVEEVLWSARNADRDLAGVKLEFPEIAACGKKQGNHGPGKYLLPLQRTTNGWEIAPVPHVLQFATTPATHGTVESFGLFSHRVTRRLPLDDALEKQKELRTAGHVVILTPEEIRIYPWNAGTRTQVEELIEAK